MSILVLVVSVRCCFRIYRAHYTCVGRRRRSHSCVDCLLMADGILRSSRDVITCSYVSDITSYAGKPSRKALWGRLESGTGFTSTIFPSKISSLQVLIPILRVDFLFVGFAMSCITIYLFWMCCMPIS